MERDSGAAQGGQALTDAQITGQQFAELLKEHVQVVVLGLFQKNAHVPPSMMIPALSAALGMVMSEVTATPDLTITMNLRKQVSDLFSDCLKKHISALQAAPAGMIKPNGSKH